MGHLEVDAKVLERDECSPLMWKYSQGIAVNVVTRRSQLAETASELKAMYSLVAAGKSVRRALSSLAELMPAVELVEPRMLDVESDFALEPKNSLTADHVQKFVGPRMVGTEPGQLLGPKISNWLQAAGELVLELTASKAAEFGLEFVLEAMY